MPTIFAPSPNWYLPKEDSHKSGFKTVSRKQPPRGGSTVEEYFAKQKPELREIAEKLRGLVKRAAPSLREELKWGFPCYVGDDNVCNIMVTGSWVDLGFFRGVDLKDPKGLLEGSGRGMRHVKVHKAEDIDTAALGALIKQAASLKPKK